MFSATTKDYT